MDFRFYSRNNFEDNIIIGWDSKLYNWRLYHRVDDAWALYCSVGCIQKFSLVLIYLQLIASTIAFLCDLGLTSIVQRINKLMSACSLKAKKTASNESAVSFN
jgi:hypothetical protein